MGNALRTISICEYCGAKLPAKDNNEGFCDAWHKVLFRRDGKQFAMQSGGSGPVRYDNGGGPGSGVVPREWFEDEPTWAAIRRSELATPEEIYQDSLDIGLMRDPKIERRIDMSKIVLP